MNQEALQKISKAKIYLLAQSPFFATLVLNTSFFEKEDIPTACTDGFTIGYNPQFINKLSYLEVAAVCAHEILHIISLHHLRREGRNPKRWNYATDYAINLILVDSGFKLPEGGLLDEQYRGKNAEEIYRLLPKDLDLPKSSMGDVTEPSVEELQKGVSALEAAIKMKVAQAVQVAKMQGKLPAGLARFADDLLQPKVDWRSALQRFITEVQRNDYCFSRPNQRYLYSGFYLPSLYNESLDNIYLFVDTSGSIGKEELDTFASEMKAILGMYRKGFTVLYVDSEVAGEQYVDPDEEVRLQPKGGGGTDYIPPYLYLEEQGITPKAVVYMTDGYCNSFPSEPDYPTLWIVYGGNNTFSPPWGEVICMD